jgi:hypothetical protein
MIWPDKTGLKIKEAKRRQAGQPLEVFQCSRMFQLTRTSYMIHTTLATNPAKVDALAVMQHWNQTSTQTTR